jgi:hypothetical protein
MGNKEGQKAAAKFQQPDPLPIEAVEADKKVGVPYVLPPQTAAGIRARQQVGFGFNDPNEIAAQGNPGSHQSHLRGLIHRDGTDPGRRFIPTPNLDEWKDAQPAQLTAADMVSQSVIHPPKELLEVCSRFEMTDNMR